MKSVLLQEQEVPEFGEVLLISGAQIVPWSLVVRAESTR